MTIRLPLPARRVFNDARPLLAIPRFGLSIRPSDGEPFAVMAEFMRPRRVAKDTLSVQCTVDDVTFEIMREDNTLKVVVARMEKTPVQAVLAMQRLPSIARAMLVFDHRARSGTPEAVAMVGLIDVFAPRANTRNLGRTSVTVNDVDLAMSDAFDAAARWMEDGYG